MRATIYWSPDRDQWVRDLGQGTLVIDSDRAVIEALLDYLDQRPQPTGPQVTRPCLSPEVHHAPPA